VCVCVWENCGGESGGRGDGTRGEGSDTSFLAPPPPAEYRNNRVVPHTISCEMSTELGTTGLSVS
jgi:hypothetical protein